MALNWADESLLASLAPEVTALANEYPDYEVYTEITRWRTRCVAQRRPGTAAHPYVVVAEYVGELRDELASADAIKDT